MPINGIPLNPISTIERPSLTRSRSILVRKVCWMSLHFDNQVIDRVRNGDVEGLCIMLTQVESIVESHLVRQVPRRHAACFDVQDAVQIAFTQTLIEFHRFEWKGEEAFLAWVLRIASNQLLNAIRDLDAQKRTPRNARVMGSADAPFLDELAVTLSTPSRAVSAAEVRDAVASALEDLPPDYAEAIRLYHLESLTARETGERMRRSPGSVYMLLQRAREALYELLGTDSKYFS